MLSDKSTVCPINLLDIAHQKRGVKAAIVNAGKLLPMLSVMDAVKENLIIPIFIGNEEEIKKCADELKFDISEFEIVNETNENSTAKIAAKLASKKKVKMMKKMKKLQLIILKKLIKKNQTLLVKKLKMKVLDRIETVSYTHLTLPTIYSV